MRALFLWNFYCYIFLQTILFFHNLSLAISMHIGIDFGTTNTDAVCIETNAMKTLNVVHRWTLPAMTLPDTASIEAVLNARQIAFNTAQHIAVTGGNRSRIPAHFHDVCPVTQHTEIESIGRGGLFLSGQRDAIIVSAGSGTAVVKATAATDTIDATNATNATDGTNATPFMAAHVTGTGIGGGTLMGLGRLVLRSHKPQTIDELALHGKAEAVNLTIQDVIGGPLGRIPPDATAVNFGRVARSPSNDGTEFRPEDLAAALVELVSQAIAVVGINAARSHEVETIVIVGHLTDMKSIHGIFQRIAEFSGVQIHIPPHGGYAVATGAVLSALAMLGS
jgi:type II pantothenate kinase